MSAERPAWSFRPALQLMGGRLIGFAATFAVPIVLVRVFEPEVFGTYKQLFLIFTTLFCLAQMGMAESLYYFLPRRPAESGRLLVNSLAVLGLSGAVAAAALTLGADRIAGWLSNPALARHLPLLGVFLLLMLVAAALEIGLLCWHRYLAATASYAVSDLVRAALLVVPAVVTGDLRWLVAGAVAFAAVRVLAELAVFGRLFGGRLRADRGLLARQLGYSLPFQAAVVVEISQANLHQFAVSHWFDAATFAIYAVGCLQIPLVELAASSAGNVLMVGMGDALGRGDRREATAIWTATTRKLALLLVPMVTLLLLVAGDLIPFLFTARYQASVPVFMVWTTAILFGVVQTDSALRVYAEVRFILVMNLVRLAVIAGSIAWAVGAFGLVGAVAVTVAGTAVAKAMALARLRRHLDAGWRRLLPWRELGRIGAASLAAALPVAALAPGLPRAAFSTLAILGTVYLAVLALLLVGCGILTADEIPAPLRRLLRAAGWRPRIEPSGSR